MNDILIIGTIAADTALNLIATRKSDLRKTLSERYINESNQRLMLINSINKEIFAQVDADYIQEVSDYGIFGGLWDYAEKRKTGIEIDLLCIPIDQATVEICEIFDINPYTSLSRNVYIMSVKSGYDACKILEKNGICATVVGKEIQSRDRVIISGDERRYLTPTDREAYFSDRFVQ